MVAPYFLCISSIFLSWLSIGQPTSYFQTSHTRELNSVCPIVLLKWLRKFAALNQNFVSCHVKSRAVVGAKRVPLWFREGGKKNYFLLVMFSRKIVEEDKIKATKAKNKLEKNFFSLLVSSLFFVKLFCLRVSLLFGYIICCDLVCVIDWSFVSCPLWQEKKR